MTTAQHLIDDCDDFNLDALPLKSGGHSGNGYRGECCMVEASNRAALCIPMLREKYGVPEKFEANHQSISPAIRSFCISFNDGLPSDEERNRLLKPYVTRILGTKTTEADEEIRAWLATDWLVRVQLPAWLDLAKLHDRAAELRALPALTSAEIARGVQSVLNGARDDAAAAWAAARDAAGDAAWDAAWAAAGAAAWAAARDAAWAAAWAAARDAAWDAAGAAAKKHLAPTVTLLQASALELLDRMISVGKLDVSA